MANSNNPIKENLVAKLVMTARLKTTSPLLMGSGKGGDAADVEVMLWDDGKPYIPASSFAGTLRSALVKDDNRLLQDASFEAFWGSSDTRKTKTLQSHIIIDDLRCHSANNIVIRDGVSIDPKTGIARNTGKYDYQLVEPGAVFHLFVEVTIREGMDFGWFKKHLEDIAQMLNNDMFRIGAMTSFGFGKFSLTECYGFAFEFTKDADTWFSYLENNIYNGKYFFELKDFTPASLPARTFRIIAEFQLKSALITGSYGIKSTDPDKSQLTSNGKPVLSGKAIKGAIRHRALKILNTLKQGSETDVNTFLDDMMGWVNNNNNDPLTHNNKAKKSRLMIDEVDLSGSVIGMTQDRIKIDRFTGGVMGGAKFDSKPVWNKGMKNFEIHFSLTNYEDHEAALLIHLLKDLWTSDLAIGGEKNIGRGILVGQKAQIQWNDNAAPGRIVKIEKSNNNIIFIDSKLDDLKPFQDAWLQKINNLQTT